MQIRSTARVGLAAKLELFCSLCKYSNRFLSSKEVISKDTENPFFYVNIRVVHGLRSTGKCLLAGQTLCGVMNIPQPPTKCSSYTSELKRECKTVMFQSMKSAVEEAVEENKNLIENDESQAGRSEIDLKAG